MISPVCESHIGEIMGASDDTQHTHRETNTQDVPDYHGDRAEMDAQGNAAALVESQHQVAQRSKA